MFIFSSFEKQKDADKDYILIYNGSIADQDGVRKVAQIAEEQGYTVKYISRLSNLPDMLTGAKAFIIGGTKDETTDLLEDLYKVQDDLKTYLLSND
jgi:SpoU rRNA methylase family enzyme